MIHGDVNDTDCCLFNNLIKRLSASGRRWSGTHAPTDVFILGNEISRFCQTSFYPKSNGGGIPRPSPAASRLVLPRSATRVKNTTRSVGAGPSRGSCARPRPRLGRTDIASRCRFTQVLGAFGRHSHRHWGAQAGAPSPSPWFGAAVSVGAWGARKPQATSPNRK